MLGPGSLGKGGTLRLHLWEHCLEGVAPAWVCFGQGAELWEGGRQRARGSAWWVVCRAGACEGLTGWRVSHVPTPGRHSSTLCAPRPIRSGCVSTAQSTRRSGSSIHTTSSSSSPLPRWAGLRLGYRVGGTASSPSHQLCLRGRGPMDSDGGLGPGLQGLVSGHPASSPLPAQPRWDTELVRQEEVAVHLPAGADGQACT